MTNQPNLDLFKIRRQYNAMLQARIEAMRKMNDEDQAHIDGFKEVQAIYAAKVDHPMWPNAKNMIDFGAPIIRMHRKNIDATQERMMDLHMEIGKGLYKRATPEIVELMQNEYPEWLEVAIHDGSIRHPVAAAIEESAIVEAEAVLEDAVENTCCGKWAVHDPFKVVSCSCARPAVVDTAAIDEFIDDYDALFGRRLAA